jgi:hypothetical protein
MTSRRACFEAILCACTAAKVAQKSIQACRIGEGWNEWTNRVLPLATLVNGETAVMSVFEMLFTTWIVGNLVLAALLVWHRFIQPRKASRIILAHQNSARTIDDFEGVVWG